MMAGGTRPELPHSLATGSLGPQNVALSQHSQDLRSSNLRHIAQDPRWTTPCNATDRVADRCIASCLRLVLSPRTRGKHVSPTDRKDDFESYGCFLSGIDRGKRVRDGTLCRCTEGGVAQRTCPSCWLFILGNTVHGVGTTLGADGAGLRRANATANCGELEVASRIVNSEKPS